jgi:hypothetical protein
LGIECSKEDIKNKDDLLLSPLLEFDGYDMELRLQWKKNIFPQINYNYLSFSAKKEFKYKDIYIVELENENSYSFFNRNDHEGSFIFESTWNLKYLWPGFEIPFEYLPKRKILIAPVLEFGLESDGYGDFKMELCYTYELYPEKKSEEYEIKFKYELELFDSYEIRIEIIYQYDIQDKKMQIQPELAFSYYF